MSGIWSFLNGKKTVIGAVITIVGYLAAGLPLLAPLVAAATLTKIVGASTLVLGLLHKVYKLVYGVEI